MSDVGYKPVDVTPVEVEVLPEGIKATSGGETNVEVPYMDYTDSKGHPYSVDYFNLGSTWNEPNGGFPKEVQAIESYIEGKITSGEVANSMTAIKNLLKGMEKVNNLNNEERALVRIETIAAYVEFLMKTDNLKQNLRRYGTR